VASLDANSASISHGAKSRIDQVGLEVMPRTLRGAAPRVRRAQRGHLLFYFVEANDPETALLRIVELVKTRIPIAKPRLRNSSKPRSRASAWRARNG
jgi:hypothetical protein